MHKTFKKLHDKLNEAMTYGFYIEAIAIEYAIIDNRITRITELLQISAQNYGFKKRFKEVKKTLKSSQFLKDYRITINESHRITNFINDRNSLIHGLVVMDLDETFVEYVAKEGIFVVNYFQNLSQKIKKRLNV